MSETPISYPAPWRVIIGLWPHIVGRTQTSVDDFSAAICASIRPEPIFIGWDRLPASARFVLVANHYQRAGLWILHPAAVLTQMVRKHYGPGDPPVRWIVTANWPRIHVGPLSFHSPGDVLLPRVADALSCYPVSFVGSNAAFSARSLRRVLREAPIADRPLGLFPEGVGGSAGTLTDPLPGVDRLLVHLAKAGLPVQPVGISERGRFVIRIGQTISAAELVQADEPARLAMCRLADLL
ncbi:MAG TPA: hypothetical protein VHZ07_27580 [Bryobacteraceae bacterium]|nr:hypothetical protein [Bryobacteraceae bacterium]